MTFYCICYLRMISTLKTELFTAYGIKSWGINFLSHNIMHNGRYVVAYVIQVFWS